MSNDVTSCTSREKAAPPRAAATALPASVWVKLAGVAVLLAMIYTRPVLLMYISWKLPDSYYSHGFLIPPIVAFLVWQRRRELRDAPVQSSGWGYGLMLAAIFLLFAGDFLGFAVFAQASLIPMLAGVCLVLLGRAHFKILWFPIAFLIFMVPIPPSVTQSLSLNLKLFAAECAVRLCRLCTLPMIREGSFVHFGDDKLLVGEVCGGLRSLISLLAIGAIMAYYSKARPWARGLTLVMSGPIAIISNVTRIFMVCVVGYFWGSQIAAGKFHDISGFCIFAIAFVLFAALEAVLRRWAPALPGPKTPATKGPGA